jgi:hypothetical protein
MQMLALEAPAPSSTHEANSIELLPVDASNSLRSSSTLHTNMVEITSDASVMIRDFLSTLSPESSSPGIIHACAAATLDVQPDQTWFFNSAASSHITGNDSFLSSVVRLPGQTLVSMASFRDKSFQLLVSVLLRSQTPTKSEKSSMSLDL